VFLPQKTVIQLLSYGVTGNDFDPIADIVIVSGSPTSTSALFVGLPLGPGYEVTVSATSEDPAIKCAAKASATVYADKTTDLLVPLQCQGPPDGNAVVNATVGECPQISYLAAAPIKTSVGGTIELAAAALDADGTTPSFSWTTTAGTFSAPALPESSFTCTVPGDATITLTVGSGSCTDHASVTVTCIASS
jgi:hypothetical protein